MNTKTCTKCKKVLSATNNNFYKQKNGKFGLQASCKTCENEYNKKRRSTEEYKKKHREKQAEWRKKNPQKELAIRKRFYKKNSERLNKERRERYITDPVYRAKKKEYEKKYKESGRRYEVGSALEQREKSKERSRKRRLDPIKKAHDLKRNAQYRKQNKDYLKKLHEETRKDLKPSYVAACMRMSVSDLTTEIYETKKIIIKLKRELKSNNIKIK